MKKLLVGTYSGFDMDDPEDMTTNSYTLGIFESDEEIKEEVVKEFDKFIDEEADCRYFTETDDEEALREVEAFKSNFDTNVLDPKDTPLYIEDLVGELYYNGDYYNETFKIYAITIEK